MKAYFDLVLDLLEIEEKDPLSALAEELALAHHRIGEVQAVELVLAWAVRAVLTGLDLLQ